MPLGVTDQFLKNAKEWADAHANPAYWRWLVARCLKHVQVPPAPTILEVGCGSGDATIALLENLPGCRIVASDISPQMLSILRARLSTEQALRCEISCVDALALRPPAEFFDLAFGASILHHIMQPELLLQRVHDALRPGCSAVFLEPYEAGNVVLRLLFEQLLRDPLGMPEAVIGMLREVIEDVEVRTQTPKSDPIFTTLDDKWMFTASRFDRLAQVSGFTSARPFTTREPQNLFRDYTEMFIRLKCGLGPDALPPSAWQTVAHYDRIFSDDLKNDLMMDGGVALHKSMARS